MPKLKRNRLGIAVNGDCIPGFEQEPLPHPWIAVNRVSRRELPIAPAMLGITERLLSRSTGLSELELLHSRSLLVTHNSQAAVYAGTMIAQSPQGACCVWAEAA